MPTTAQLISRPLPVRAAVSGITAAAATTVTAAIADAAGASLEVSGKPIPLSAFPFWTLVAAVAGAMAARFTTRRVFVTLTLTATVLSMIPALAAPDDHATRFVLVLAHAVAAVILIPTLRPAQ